MSLDPAGEVEWAEIRSDFGTLWMTAGHKSRFPTGLQGVSRGYTSIWSIPVSPRRPGDYKMEAQ
jgi:hypothetical protein